MNVTKIEMRSEAGEKDMRIYPSVHHESVFERSRGVGGGDGLKTDGLKMNALKMRGKKDLWMAKELMVG